MTAVLRAAARQQLASYLQRHPGDVGRLAALQRQFDEDEGDLFSRSNMRGHITTSAFVLDPGLQQILMIHHRTLQRWLQPGGHHEPGQTLWESAVREATEETGVATLSAHPHVGSNLPLDIDSHAIPANVQKGEAAHWHHDYAYLMIAPLDAVLRPQLDEVSGVAWRRLDELADEARFRALALKLAAFC
ncbi:NUDIX hydrolase [soil metagenome]